MMYYGQAGQDSIITQFFSEKNIKNGTFLDVGALDGIRFSNTFLLEQDGWRGICVEMHPSYFDMLKNNRPNSICYSCAAADEDGVSREGSLNYRASLSTTDFGLEDYYENSGYKPYYGDRNIKEIDGYLNGRHEVPFRTINSILDENSEKFSKINFVSVDIDGSEKMALPHLDLDKCNPELLSLEHSVLGDDYMIEYASSYGYTPAIKIGSDIFFVKDVDDINLINQFSVIGEQYHNTHPVEEN